MDRAVIMERTSQGLDVFRHYIPIQFKVGNAFSSPLREDKHPSFNIYKDESGEYKWKDFAADEGGDAISYVMRSKDLNYGEACLLIARDFMITPKIPVKYKDTQTQNKLHQTRELNTEELAYWSQYGITANILSKYKVLASYQSNVQNPVFIYGFEWGQKIYRPKSDQRFFRINAYDSDESYIFGLDQLPDRGLYLFLAAGEKDVMSLAAKGFHAICFNSESQTIDQGLIRDLRRRFSYVLICYDQDDAGRKATRKHVKEIEDLIAIDLPFAESKKEKDVSDFFSLGNTADDLASLIMKSVEKYFEQTLRELSDMKFQFHKDIPKPVPICRIDEASILTAGNLSVIAGKPKGGKSAVAMSILSGALSINSDNQNYFLGIDIAKNFGNKAILHFDTEQSQYDHHQRIKRSVYNAGYDSDVPHFHSFSLLGFSPWERCRFIEHMVNYYSIVHSGIFLVLIDGVADLIGSVNDEESANKVVNLLHHLATENQTGIMLILHLNPDGIKTRGHLGSQLDRKAESVIVIEKKDNEHFIDPKLCRNAGVNQMSTHSFFWDDTLMQFVYKGAVSTQDRKQKKHEENEEVLTVALEQQEYWKRKELLEFLMEYTGLGKTAVYNQINQMLDDGLLQNADGVLRICLE